MSAEEGREKKEGQKFNSYHNKGEIQILKSKSKRKVMEHKLYLFNIWLIVVRMLQLNNVSDSTTHSVGRLEGAPDFPVISSEYIKLSLFRGIHFSYRLDLVLNTQWCLT